MNSVPCSSPPPTADPAACAPAPQRARSRLARLTAALALALASCGGGAPATSPVPGTPAASAGMQASATAPAGTGASAGRTTSAADSSVAGHGSAGRPSSSSSGGVSGELAAVGGRPAAGGSGGAPEHAAGAGGSAPDAGHADSEDAGIPPDSGVSDAGHDAGVIECRDCCADGLSRGDTQPGTRALAHFTPSPADVTVCPNGDIFLTLDGPDEIWSVPVPSGEPVRYAAVSGVQPAGIACDDRGRLFVAGFALRSGSSLRSPALLLVTGKDAPARALPQPRGATFATPNGVAFAAGCGIYTTDTLSGLIVRTSEASSDEFTSSVEARGLLGVNGVAFDPAARKLYVSNSLTQEVVGFALDSDCKLGRSERLWKGDTAGALLDGLAVDERGAVYVASYEPGPVLRLPSADKVAEVTHPASLAFRGGTLLVVDYHLNQPTLEGGLYAVALGVCGADVFGSRR